MNHIDHHDSLLFMKTSLIANYMLKFKTEIRQTEISGQCKKRASKAQHCKTSNECRPQFADSSFR